MIQEQPKFDMSPTDLGLRVTVQSAIDGQSTDLLFEELPVRVGRNSLNELVLNHPYVSQWHAVIGLVRGALSIVQISNTNSVRVGERKLGPQEEVALTGDENIRIEPFALQIQLVSLPPSFRKQKPSGGSYVTTAGATRSGSGPAPMESVAVRIVDRLAQRFLGRTITEPRELAAFGARLEETLDVFFRCLAALKKGQEQFRTALDLRALEPRADDVVERAATAAELAAVLLAPATSAAASLERAFKNIMIHEVALLNGLMAGVHNLLDRLSPKVVAKEASKRQRSPNSKQLWETFEQMHHELAEEDTATFEMVFGRQFDKAYANVAAKKKS